MFLSLLVVVVVGWTVNPSAGFVSTRFLGLLLNGVELSLTNDSTITHQDMTREAILDVATEILRDNLESEESSSMFPDLLGSGSGSGFASGSGFPGIEDPSIDPSVMNLLTSQSFRAATAAINEANAEVDLGPEEALPAAHFDNEEFQNGQNRLVDLRQNVLAQILASNFELARREAGRMLHTLQDFYSSSNYIENGNREPYSVLGRENERPENIADPDTPSCMDCEEDGSFVLQVIFGFVETSHTLYDCQNNIERSHTLNGILTSGYYSSRGDQVKPPGKCSHGGFMDTTTDTFARGGINKDSAVQELSPHYYLHEEAAKVAQEATADILREIRSDVNDDELFGMFLGLNVVQTISIAYVIDTTGSMGEELPEIQATIPTIRVDLEVFVNSFEGEVRVRYILVPFNDPDPGITIITEDVEEFLAEIGNLVASGGGDIPEPSIGAIIRAVEASEVGAPIFVFTDAIASDEERLIEAVSLISERDVRITFALVSTTSSSKRSVDNDQQLLEPESRAKRQVDNGIYEQIAALSGGQILNLDTDDLSELGSLVTFSAIQSRRTILCISDFVFDTVVHTFPVDSSIVELMFSINGDSISVTVTTPNGIDVSTLPQFSSSLVSFTSYIAGVDITDDSLRGEWTISITSFGSYSIQISGDSGLSFSDDLFRLDPSSTNGISLIDGRPTEGEPIIALLSVDGDIPVTITTLNLITNNGVILQSLDNLTRLDQDSYGAVFVPPSEVFTLQLLGVDDNGFAFSHKSDTSVEVATISLSLGEDDTEFVTLRSGESTTVTLVLVNGGDSTTFDITVNTAASGGDNTDFLSYTVTPTSIFVDSNSSSEISVLITVTDTGTNEGSEVTFTVLAESAFSDAVNDFTVFTVGVTARPLPQFTANVISSFDLTLPTPCYCSRVQELGLFFRRCEY